MNDLDVLMNHRDIFRDYWDPEKTEIHTTMFWGLECPDEWMPELDRLCYGLEAYNTKTQAVVADQVKIKFGGLRFYFHLEDGEGNELMYADNEKAWSAISGMITLTERSCARIEKELGNIHE